MLMDPSNLFSTDKFIWQKTMKSGKRANCSVLCDVIFVIYDHISIAHFVICGILHAIAPHIRQNRVKYLNIYDTILQ